MSKPKLGDIVRCNDDCDKRVSVVIGVFGDLIQSVNVAELEGIQEGAFTPMINDWYPADKVEVIRKRVKQVTND